jgi:hypothetical protein
VPTEAAVAFLLGACIEIANTGAGQITVSDQQQVPQIGVCRIRTGDQGAQQRPQADGLRAARRAQWVKDDDVETIRDAGDQPCGRCHSELALPAVGHPWLIIPDAGRALHALVRRRRSMHGGCE